MGRTKQTARMSTGKPVAVFVPHFIPPTSNIEPIIIDDPINHDSDARFLPPPMEPLLSSREEKFELIKADLEEVIRMKRRCSRRAEKARRKLDDCDRQIRDLLDYKANLAEIHNRAVNDEVVYLEQQRDLALRLVTNDF